MVSATLLHEVESLPDGDRLVLLGRLWDSLTLAPTDHELREARLGLNLHRADPVAAREWDAVIEDMRQKYV